MKKLLESIEELKRGQVRDIIGKRLKEFEEIGKKPNREVFKELCYCILCANYTAEGSIRIQREIADGFLDLSKPQLAKKLRLLGHRFPTKRAEYIAEAKQYGDSIRDIADSACDETELRNWLIMNIRGIGPKEASHFLRNIGYTDLAILDFHIIKVLARHGVIKKPKTLTKRRYIEIENILREIARNANLSLAELDLYLWYMETGKVLK